MSDQRSDRPFKGDMRRDPRWRGRYADQLPQPEEFPDRSTFADDPDRQAAIAAHKARIAAARRCPTPGCRGPGASIFDQGPNDEDAVTVPCTHCGRTKP